MSMDINGLVESSTNLGVVHTTESLVTFECAVRSSVKTLKEDILRFVGSCAAWGAGYASMWGSKWILGTLITDENEEKVYINATVKVVAINKAGKLYRSLPEQVMKIVQ